MKDVEQQPGMSHLDSGLFKASVTSFLGGDGVAGSKVTPLSAFMHLCVRKWAQN